MIDDFILNKCTQKLLLLKRGGTKYGLAPHKPLLLLAVIDSIEQQEIHQNQIPVRQYLFERFEYLWGILMPNVSVGDITQPLHYLSSDVIWILIGKDGNRINRKLSSKLQVSKRVAYGILDQDLFQLLVNDTTRPLIKMILLDHYFPETKNNLLQEYTLPSYISEIENIIVEEASSTYRRIERVEEGFVRDWKFRAYIMQLYDSTCCISGFQVTPNFKIIEACHIKEHAQFGIDTVTNGIPLCVNLHRAFDAGLISLSDQYEVLVKNQKIFKENQSPFNIRQFEGIKISLPHNKNYYPKQDNLEWHRKRHGF